MKLTALRVLLCLLCVSMIAACDQDSGQASAPSALADSSDNKAPAIAPSGVPLNLAGIWQRSAGALTPVVLTEYGLAKSQETDVFDDPNVECRGYSIPRSTLSGFGVTKIEVGTDHVIFRYEANAGTRKVFLDAKTQSQDSGLNGRSIGSVARGVVSIISKEFGEEGKNAFMARGVRDAGTVYPMGEAFTLFERYQVIDNNTLDFVMVMQDPKILEIPRVIHAQWTRLSDDTPFLQEECVLPEDEFFKAEEE